MRSTEDRNSAVSSGNDEYDIVYTWEKGELGRNTLRKNLTTLPSGAVLDYDYRDTSGRHDSDVSRASSIKHGATLVAAYRYNGVGQVVETDLMQCDVRSTRFSSTSGDYEDWDRFNRITTDDWEAYSGTDTNFYEIDLTYDRNSNITVIEDNVHSGFDVDYTMDDIDRLTQAEEGTWGGSSITTTSRDQQWTLDQVGNWDVDKLDLNGDGDFTDTDELHDDRTHSDVNEITARDVDNSGSDDYTLVYDAAGNLTDDGESYKYEYDAFYRLRFVKDQSDDVVAEHRYNGLGHRIGEHVDTDDDGDVDGSDEWRYFANDERWRIVAHFLGSDTAPTEEFVHHAAGLSGRGWSSYIDLVVMRERDTDDNGSMEERMYYCQNWRADVSAIVSSNGEMYEWVKYSAYGVPIGLPGADTDSDGDCDSTDITQIQTWIDPTYTYDVRGDVDLDGNVEADDKSESVSRLEGRALGRGLLSDLGSNKGMNGYSHQGETGIYVVRHRSLISSGGRWNARDPNGYAEGVSLYEYVNGRPTAMSDPMGLQGEPPPQFGTHCDELDPDPPEPEFNAHDLCSAQYGSPPNGCCYQLDQACLSSARALRKLAIATEAYGPACSSIKRRKGEANTAIRNSFLERTSCLIDPPFGGAQRCREEHAQRMRDINSDMNEDVGQIGGEYVSQVSHIDIQFKLLIVNCCQTRCGEMQLCPGPGAP